MPQRAASEGLRLRAAAAAAAAAVAGVGVARQTHTLVVRRIRLVRDG